MDGAGQTCCVSAECRDDPLAIIYFNLAVITMGLHNAVSIPFHPHLASDVYHRPSYSQSVPSIVFYFGLWKSRIFEAPSPTPTSAKSCPIIGIKAIDFPGVFGSLTLCYEAWFLG